MYERDYDAIASRITAAGTRDERMTAAADALWEGLHDQGVSWVGFYLDQPGEPRNLRMVLGPHRNKPACSPIGLHGACGQALTSRSTLIVHDVEDLGPGYIACDPRDRSEIIIPLEDDGGYWGVLDLDSHDTGAFGPADEAGLTRVLVAAGLLGRLS